MTSKYDNIETVADLVNEVMLHGFSTAQEDIIRVQDILGGSTVGEIAFLAKGGEQNETFTPYPKNSRIQPTFFNIIFSCWDRDRAVALYNEHVTKYPAELKSLREIERKLETANYKLVGGLAQTKANWQDEKMLRQAAEEELAAAKQEILKLKAKLYDQMTAGT